MYQYVVNRKFYIIMDDDKSYVKKVQKRSQYNEKLRK